MEPDDKPQRLSNDWRRRTAVLGGVGGDAHSVGVVTLRRILERVGYEVIYLSTQNSAQQLCEAAVDADVVLVSNMDGHARHYLEGLRDIKEDYPGSALWYLGGNPSVCSEEEEALAELAPLGFDRVYLGYVEPAELLRTLEGDLADRQPAARVRGRARPGDADAPRPSSQQFGRSTRVELREHRDDVLNGWSTGAAAIDFAVNAEHLAAATTLGDRQRIARESGQILLHPRTGVAGLEEQRRLFDVMAAAGADVLSFQIDSLTRNNAYEQIELLLKACFVNELPAQLNGFPMVNYGIEPIREMVARHPDTPFQVRHSTRDPRLLAEIAYAAGVAAFEGGPLTYNLPYYRDYHPRDSLAAWDYVEALTGHYFTEHGVAIDREFFGVLTAALVPPALAISVNVLEALWAARRGVRSVSLGYAEQGHQAQDVTAIWAMEDLARRYLSDSGHGDVQVSTVFHQYMAAFPQSPDKSRQLLQGSARTAAISGATRLMLKTYVESRRIPSAPQNAHSLLLVRESLDQVVRGGRAEHRYAGEYERVVTESLSILDAVLDLPGSLADQIATAISTGMIDVPFSPSVWNRGEVVPIRDSSGAVRLADIGQLPLPSDIAQLHRDETETRLKAMGGPVDAVLEHDLLAIGRGQFQDWPLDT